MGMYKKDKFDNELRIVAHNMPSMQSLALGIWINVGGRYENAGEKGTSHFLEHLVFKGTKKYSCRKIKESIEGVGGSLNGFTSEELTCYLVKIPAEYLELALDVLSDMVLSPSLPMQDIDKERQVILEEIKMYKDLPQSYVYELLDELLWPGQPLGLPITGTFESVSSIQRKDLSAFKQKYYSLPNIVISAAGQLDYQKFKEIAGRNFASLKQEEKNSFSKAFRRQKAAQLKVFHKATEQTHLALGFHSLHREHRLRHALGMLHIILGANMSSRLFNELREKRGLAYEIGTAVKRYHDTGAFIVHAGIDNRKIIESVQLILKELKKTKSELVSEGEFKRAKEFYIGQLKLGLEDTLDHMLWIGESTASENKTHSLSQIIEEVNKVNRQHIQETAGFIFQDSKLNLALIGPVKSEEKSIHNSLSVN
jgi:predicted Zn-dependent peptidase